MIYLNFVPKTKVESVMGRNPYSDHPSNIFGVNRPNLKKLGIELCIYIYLPTSLLKLCGTEL